jgi:hypothetical protein
VRGLNQRERKKEKDIKKDRERERRVREESLGNTFSEDVSSEFMSESYFVRGLPATGEDT